jgi:hypothetical protein
MNQSYRPASKLKLFLKKHKNSELWKHLTAEQALAFVCLMLGRSPQAFFQVSSLLYLDLCLITSLPVPSGGGAASLVSGGPPPLFPRKRSALVLPWDTYQFPGCHFLPGSSKPP